MVRIAAALGGLLFTTAVGNLFGARGLGQVGFIQTFILLMVLISQVGMDRTLIRFVASSVATEGGLNPIWYLRLGLKISVSVALSVSLAAYLYYSSLSIVANFSINTELYRWMVFSIVPIVVSHIMAAYLKGHGRTLVSCFLEQGFISLYAAIGIVVVSLGGGEIALDTIGKCYLVGSFISTLLGFIVIKSSALRLRTSFESAAQGSTLIFLRASGNYMLVAICSYISVSGSILVAGVNLEVDQLGFLRAAERAVLLVSFPLAIVNTIYPPKFAAAWAVADLARLRLYFQRSRQIAVLMATLVLFPFVFFPGLMMSLIIREEGYPIVLILFALGAFSNVFFGSVGNILSMTGSERISRNISIIMLPLSSVLYYFSSFFWGVYGVAVAYFAVSLCWNYVMYFYVKNDVFGGRV